MVLKIVIHNLLLKKSHCQTQSVNQFVFLTAGEGSRRRDKVWIAMKILQSGNNVRYYIETQWGTGLGAHKMVFQH